uniref:Ig-like domain-containing protein n=1 Tax=Anabas testudineus TaxID=64144 RepID=A0A7N6BV89_ANATE
LRLQVYLWFLKFPDVKWEADVSHITLKVKPGEDAVLQCDGPKDVQITMLEWIRPDLNSDGYVFFYRDERLYKNYLHQSFVDRVELIDPKMKNGDVSVILRNVTDTDTGTYKCYVSVSKASRRQRQLEKPGNGRNTSTYVALIVSFFVVVVLVLGIVLKRKILKSPHSPDEELYPQQV